MGLCGLPPPPTICCYHQAGVGGRGRVLGPPGGKSLVPSQPSRCRPAHCPPLRSPQRGLAGRRRQPVGCRRTERRSSPWTPVGSSSGGSARLCGVTPRGPAVTWWPLESVWVFFPPLAHQGALLHVFTPVTHKAQLESHSWWAVVVLAGAVLTGAPQPLRTNTFVPVPGRPVLHGHVISPGWFSFLSLS